MSPLFSGAVAAGNGLVRDMNSKLTKHSFPPWLRCRLCSTESVKSTVATLDALGLNTVCQSAHCPNIGECFARKTATFLVLGNVCTRACRFCAVTKGRPGQLDSAEPANVARAVARLGLRYTVITSVTRDDLADGGSGHFVETIQAVRARCPGVRIEVLVPDFRGEPTSVEAVVEARPDVFGHNVETVPRLYGAVRPGADYSRSLTVLRLAKKLNERTVTKSGLMVGLGENRDGVLAVMRDLRSVRCDILTIGQYLSPSKSHFPVVEYVRPEVFDDYARIGEDLGFKYVASGPLVRSSYMADRAFLLATEQGVWRDGVRSQSAGYG
jgi:lipoic acid synthetase